ncbi:MAG: CPBP family intramembrane metalloprotease [Candidatus Lokiarchaeota archaeon]|nr:CPBP family intramembrane metalloprotease [Candidatus Lokiarchaeota archaeon]
MESATVDVEDKYWPKIWNYKSENYLEEKIVKTNKESLIKVAIVVFSMAILCLPIFGWYLDAFYWEWIGYGLIFFGIFWILFLSPFSNMRKSDIKKYIQDVIFDDPKHPGVFVKETLKEQKYEWGAFVYFWMFGCCGFIYFNDNVWQNMMPYQHYWLNSLPTAVPIALILALAVSVIFGIILSRAIPETRRGKTRKKMFMIWLVIALLGLFVMTFVHAVEMQDFLQNFESYSIRYPEDPDDKLFLLNEIYINYNMFFWALGLILSSLIVVGFGLVCSAYQNHKLRKTVLNVYGQYLAENVELNWEYHPHKERLEYQRKAKKKIKKVAAIELTTSFSMVMFALWVIYFILGEAQDNQAMMNLGIVIMGIELIWVLFLSPIFHWRFERGIIYRGKTDNLGYVELEDRGIGSWRKFWRVHRKDKSKMKTLILINLLSILGVLGFGIIPEGEVVSVFEAIGISENNMVAAMSTLYAIVSIILLVYSINVLKFPDSQDPEQGKKKIYAILFIGFAFGLVFIGIPHLIYDKGLIIADFYANFSWGSLWALFAPVIILGVLLGLINVLFWPLFIKYEDMYETIKDLIMILAFGVFLLTVWNVLCDIFFAVGSDYMHHSWRIGEVPVELREDFHIGEFLVGVFGYHYWGWVQELLFLGYFCWLSWKIFPNPNSHHKWINATISSLLFGLFHYDNMPLMIGTMIGGFMWALWWGERRNLWMMGLMHGFNGSLVDWLIPMSMTVGPGGL